MVRLVALLSVVSKPGEAFGPGIKTGKSPSAKLTKPESHVVSDSRQSNLREAPVIASAAKQSSTSFDLSNTTGLCCKGV